MILKLAIAFVLFIVIKHRYFWKVSGSLRFKAPTPFLIAHRGYKKNYSANSMGSFVAAQNHGFQWIEMDVICTKDKEVICSHNFDLEKETIVKGYITDLYYNSLKPIIYEHNITLEEQNILLRLLDVFKKLD